MEKKKILLDTPIALFLVLVAWMIASFVEINLHSLDSGYKYCKYNFFCLIVTDAKASTEMAKHENKKGIARLPEIKRINTDNIKESDIRMCINWMQTDIGQWATEYAESQGCNKYLMVSQIFSESRFAPTIVSHSGAVGLMQILPTYSGKYMNEVGANNLYNTQDNIKVGLCIYNSWLAESDGSVRAALAKYNGGTYGFRKSQSLKYADDIIYRALALQQAVEQN